MSPIAAMRRCRRGNVVRSVNVTRGIALSRRVATRRDRRRRPAREGYSKVGPEWLLLLAAPPFATCRRRSALLSLPLLDLRLLLSCQDGQDLRAHALLQRLHFLPLAFANVPDLILLRRGQIEGLQRDASQRPPTAATAPRTAAARTLRHRRPCCQGGDQQRRSNRLESNHEKASSDSLDGTGRGARAAKL